MEPARPSRDSDRTKVARTVKRALAKRRAKLHGDSDGEPEQYASFTMIPSEKNITVKIALDVSFGKSAHISPHPRAVPHICHICHILWRNCIASENI